VKSVPIGGGAETTLASGPGAVWGVAVDSQFVYWTNYDANTVLKLPKQADAGAPLTLAAGQNTPAAIAVDSTNVYWVNQGDGSMFTVPK
jgi:hypothetical protein